MTKTERLKQAYKELKLGKIIEFIPDVNERVLNRGCCCWLGYSNNKNYIRWQYFGSSSNRMTLNDLRWIAINIGKCTTYEYKIVESVY